MAHLPRRDAPFTHQLSATSAASHAPSPSNRVTRSSARLAESPSSSNPADTPRSTARRSATRKRKLPSHHEASHSQEEAGSSPPTVNSHRVKRQKTTVPHHQTPAGTGQSQKKSAVIDTAMSSNGSSSKNVEESTKSSKTSSRRTSSRGNNSQPRGKGRSRAVAAGDLYLTDVSPSNDTALRRQKKRPSKKDHDVSMQDDDQVSGKPSKRENESTPPPPPPLHQPESNDDASPDAGDEDGQDPFTTALFGRGAPSGLSNTLRALSGMMSGMSARLRDILNNLRQVDNPTMQFVALEELSNLLLVSNEDNLSGQFSPDPYVKELVALMQPNAITGEENPEMMLLACRCIANLMEAMRGSVANVVYGGAVPVLCQKLLDIQYIDVAEQALSTLSKVSIDFPASIVREGGLTACLQFLDFFATGTQRTAVMTAANCCRNIPHDSFPVIRDVMPILQNVLISHDQKVVEQGCLCVTRIIDSFKHSPDKLEKLVNPALLKAVLGLLLPGTTNLIGANIHTEFLRVIAIVARASPKLSTELLKMNVVDTLYQILAGVSAPSETADAASKIDSVVIMQALIHRPRDQIYETLNVVCELLPRAKLTSGPGMEINDFDESFSDESDESGGKKPRTQQRLELLKQCKDETRRFAIILLPTLTDAYSSTVNLSVRQKVLNAQLKILSNLETQVIEEALRPVPYASFLASILSQEDHPSLVMSAIQASELLFERLEDIYQYQFHREGVIGEIKKLASRTLEVDIKTATSNPKPVSEQEKLSGVPGNRIVLGIGNRSGDQGDRGRDDDDDEQDEADEDEEANGEEDEDEDEIIVRDDAELNESHSSDSSDEDVSSPVAIAGIKDLVIMRAKKFLEQCDTDTGKDAKEQASKIRNDLRKLASAISDCYNGAAASNYGQQLFGKLANYFEGDALESITSSELLDSGIIRVLVEVLSENAELFGNPRGDFVVSFMGSTKSGNIKTTTASANTTAFSILIHKLQDLFSRSEHFEVLTVNSSAAENSRSSSTSMLSRQIRLKLSAGIDSEIPVTYREMIVSIHAIATFKALDDYLRPRISISERPSSGQKRREILQQLANARMAQLASAAESGMFSPFGTELGLPPSLPGTGNARSTTRPSSQTKPASHEKPEQDEKKSEAKRKRSSRRNQPLNAEASQVVRPPEPDLDTAQNTLECADEKPMDTEDQHDGDGSHEAFDAIVGELEEEISEDEPEPGAVNMEIGTSGRVTAREEDGTRVYTPQQPGTPVQGLPKPVSSQPASSLSLREHSNTLRPSYAAALASTPDDWHIEFSIDDKAIPHNTTIYRAVHHNRDQPQDPMGRSVWSVVHAIKFKKVKGPPPADADLTPGAGSSQTDVDGLPPALNGHPITSSILSLLGLLHELNANLDDIREEFGGTELRLYAESLASFINTKLTAKMNRQLEEPLIVASNCLPSWSEDLARTFPFLFPFETRHLFLQSTSFGYSRSITRWQNNQEQNDDRRDRRRDDRPVMGRPQRQKVRISRNRILESAMKVMEMYGASPSVLEVEYFEEVGTGLGPTLEFYATVSKEFSKKKLKMWRENDSSEKDSYAFGKNGLFPAPMKEEDVDNEHGQKLLHFFKMLGKFVARSMLDSRIIDISFNPTFFKIGWDLAATHSIALLRTVDYDLANSIAQLQEFAHMKANIADNDDMTLEQKKFAISELSVRGVKVEDLMLDFTLPGYGIELVPAGSDRAVDTDNVGEYIDRVLDLSLGSGVRHQIAAFQKGFSQVFSYSSLKAFTSKELVMLFGRVEEDWSIETLMDSIKADHGFNMDSKSVKNLLQTMSEFTQQQRRNFLQFVTGSPRLPIGGFKSLTPMFTVVCKPSEPPYTSDDYLPSVMTCVNYLKLPDYGNQETMKKKLDVAIREGQGAFHLS